MTVYLYVLDTLSDWDVGYITAELNSGRFFNKAKPAVVDGNLITATGLAPLEFSYEVLNKTNAMKPETLEAWYQLNKTKDSKYFFAIMESLQ